MHYCLSTVIYNFTAEEIEILIRKKIDIDFPKNLIYLISHKNKNAYSNN